MVAAMAKAHSSKPTVQAATGPTTARPNCQAQRRPRPAVLLVSFFFPHRAPKPAGLSFFLSRVERPWPAVFSLPSSCKAKHWLHQPTSKPCPAIEPRPSCQVSPHAMPPTWPLSVQSPTHVKVGHFDARQGSSARNLYIIKKCLFVMKWVGKKEIKKLRKLKRKTEAWTERKERI